MDHPIHLQLFPIIEWVQNVLLNLLGFYGMKVNYWWEPEPGTLYSSNVWCDDCEETMVIGVIPNENYWINVQVFNTVGLGPKGEDTFISLLLNRKKLSHSLPFSFPPSVPVCVCVSEMLLTYFELFLEILLHKVVHCISWFVVSSLVVPGVRDGVIPRS